MNLDLSKHHIKSGEQHPKAKLTEKEVKIIRQYYGGGFKQKELAEMFGVSRSNIDAIVNRRTWRDL
jgi:DNA-directed RNA polymerase specialized sigma subunit